jgi:hypothetical protein
MRIAQSDNAAKYFMPRARGRLAPFLANTTPRPARGNRSEAQTLGFQFANSNGAISPLFRPPVHLPGLFTSPRDGATFRNDDNHNYEQGLDRIHTLPEPSYRAAEEDLRLHRHPIHRNPRPCYSRLP